MKRRERLHRQPRKKFEWLRKLNIFKILSILLIIFFVLSIPTVIKKLILIKVVECKSQYGECPEVILNEIKTFKPTDYKNSKSKFENILKSTSAVTNFLIQYKIPSTLKIELNLKKPKYAIHDGSDKYLLIDSDGNILEAVTETNLPQVIKKDSNYKVGDKITENDNTALKIYEKTSLILTVSSGTIENDILKVILNEGVLVYFPLDKDVDTLVGGLRLIFSRLNEDSQGIKMEDIREIDLRFANPVLR